MLKEEIIKPQIVEKIEDALDINFNASVTEIDSFEKFKTELYLPFIRGDKLYYRGERIFSEERRLIPTLLREKAAELKELRTERALNINAKSLFELYSSKKQFMDIYFLLYGEADIHKMYNMTAFAQHYLDISPFIDFTKSLYVAVSFALKGREAARDDFVIYTVRDILNNDTTEDIEQVNEWLSEYNVNIININPIGKADILSKISQKKIKSIKQQRELIEEIKNKNIISEFKRFEKALTSLLPGAKLIDIPTNDLMKFQQGVFLLLDGFNLIDSKYLTKGIRQEFEIKKYIINKELAFELNRLITKNAPEYRYECLLNISKAVRNYN